MPGPSLGSFGVVYDAVGSICKERDTHESPVERNEQFRVFEQCIKSVQLLPGETVKGVAVSRSRTEEEGARDDVIDAATLIPQCTIEGKPKQLPLFVTDECYRLVKWVNSLDWAAHHRLHRC